MLTTLAALQLIPVSPTPNPVWLNQLLSEADAGIKSWIKRDIELTSYPGAAVNGVGDSGYYSGMNEPDIVLRQYPILLPQTTIAAGSNNQPVSSATINVASTTGFASTGTFSISLGSSSSPSSAAVTYTGLTSTSFTGCSVATTHSTGTLATNQMVWGIAVWFDQTSMGGQYPGAYANQTLLTIGQGYMVPTTRIIGGVPAAMKGTIQRVGYQSVWGGYQGWGQQDAKLSANRLPCWPQGYQNVKIAYTAGYPTVPADLAYACQELVTWMVQNLPYGGQLQSQTLGAYSYTLLAQAAKGMIPQLGGIARTLATYRDLALGGG